jgi:hypothetical protein
LDVFDDILNRTEFGFLRSQDGRNVFFLRVGKKLVQLTDQLMILVCDNARRSVNGRVRPTCLRWTSFVVILGLLVEGPAARDGSEMGEAERRASGETSLWRVLMTGMML